MNPDNCIKSLLLTFLIIFYFKINAQESSYNKTLNLSEVGINKSDATSDMLKVIEMSKKKDIERILIPRDTYEFFPLKAFEKYVAISNNDNGLKRIAFPIIDFQKLEIDGQGSTFIFHGAMIPFYIENSSNISIKNINIDWKRPFHSEGKVIAVDEKSKTFDLQISEEFHYTIRGNELIYVGEDGYEQGLQENVFFDPITKGIVYDNTNYWMDPWMKRLDYEYSATEISKGVVRILDTVANALPKPGWIFATKGQKMPNRISPAIHAIFSSDIKISDVNIYHAGSMGLIAEGSRNIDLNRFNVILAPQSTRFMTSAADATHFVGCQGNITLKDCLFENMHDDGVNIHGTYTMVDNSIDNKTIGIRLMHKQQHGFTFARSGDSIRLVDRTTLLPYACLKVKDIKAINEEYSHLIFNEDVVKILKPNTALENISQYPEKVLIKGCTIRNNRARGILISTPGQVEITDNFFSNEMAAISIGGDANFWWESGPVNNVLIKNNKFYNCCITKQNQAVIMIQPKILKQEESSGFYERNIRIENNIFETFDNMILTANSVDGLKFNYNQIIKTKNFTPFYPNDPAIKIKNSNNLEILKNTYSGDKTAFIELDGRAKIKIIKGNNGFSKNLSLIK